VWWLTATDDPVAWCVSLSVTWLCCAKMAECIRDPSHIVLGGVSIPLWWGEGEWGHNFARSKVWKRCWHSMQPLPNYFGLIFHLVIVRLFSNYGTPLVSWYNWLVLCYVFVVDISVLWNSSRDSVRGWNSRGGGRRRISGKQMPLDLSQWILKHYNMRLLSLWVSVSREWIAQ